MLFVTPSMAHVSVREVSEEKNAKIFAPKGRMDKIVSFVANVKMEQVVHLRQVSVSVNPAGEDFFAIDLVNQTVMVKDVLRLATAQI